jgi:aminoglycoside phosphotransferase (APT) family kinase protein
MIVGVHKDEITADVAARLVAAQFPQWAGLPVTPVTLDGWDNTTFRLGDELSIRLPSSPGRGRSTAGSRASPRARAGLTT